MSHSSDSQPTGNRLLAESSPYLQQHAYNPVDWFPWGTEAFETARREDKPIFLSVGYSACHWCHVMEHESFENQEIADFLNAHFISVKVDREERPDVDQIYMSAVQLITRRGGWPMSVFMTAEGEPYYGGTYWPPHSRLGMPGFLDILHKLNDYWTNRREEVLNSASKLSEAIDEMSAPLFEQAVLDEDVLRNSMQQLISSADRVHGGFGSAPKFPHPMDLRMLLRCGVRFGDQQALDLAHLSLQKMADGGIYDQLGGGFHRYSTDAVWLVPHFEKMLYDNALLVPAYLEAYQITKNPEFARIVHETLEYVEREMTSPDGGFYSTQDADTEGVEGKFFVWSHAEISEVLGASEAKLFNDAYDVSERGNWEGHNILNRPRTFAEIAARHGIEESELNQRLDAARKTLFSRRAERVSPGLDQKILASWNGMMISAFAQAAAVFQNESYAKTAAQACDFVLKRLKDDQGRLTHSWQGGVARFNAYLDDYACLIEAFVETAQSAQRWDLLGQATALADEAIEHFWDAEHGGFFYTGNDHEELLTRTKESQDNAVPSGNGMMATALLKLGLMTSQPRIEEMGVKTLDYLSGLIADHPRASGQALMALDFLIGPTQEFVILDSQNAFTSHCEQAIATTFLPNKIVVKTPLDQPVKLDLVLGKTESLSTGVFICERGVCQQPVTTERDFDQALRQIVRATSSQNAASQNEE